MRIIDKTPFVEEDGSISIINRIQGTLQNGFSWYSNLQAQQKAIDILKKRLDKKFTLIRNHTLGASKITVPLILVGPPGVYVFLVSNLEGTYRAKADSWGTVDGEKYKEASINLLKRTAQLGKAVQIYLQRQGVELPNGTEPVLMTLNPGIHVESIRPMVRVVMSDAVERFAASLTQASPIMSVADGHQLSEAILNPIRKSPTPVQPSEAKESESSFSPPVEEPSAPAYGDLGFSFDDDEESPAEPIDPAPATPPLELTTPRSSQAKRHNPSKVEKALLGMTKTQLIVLAVMAGFLALLLIAVTFAALLFI